MKAKRKYTHTTAYIAKKHFERLESIPNWTDDDRLFYVFFEKSVEHILELFYGDIDVELSTFRGLSGRYKEQLNYLHIINLI